MAYTVARLVNNLFTIFHILILARIILGFFPVSPYQNRTLWNIVQVVYNLTEPIMAPFRSIIPPLQVGGGSYLDFSPIIALLVLSLLQNLVTRIVYLIL